MDPNDNSRVDRPCATCKRPVHGTPGYVAPEIVSCLSCDEERRRSRETAKFKDLLARTVAAVHEDAPCCCVACKAERVNGFAGCSTCLEVEQFKWQEREHRRALGPALESIPERGRWATHGPDALAKLKNREAVRIVEAFTFEPPLLMLAGGGGAGKTALGAAKFAAELGVPVAQKRWRYDSLFVSAWRVGQHRFEARMGAPMSLLRDAQAAHLLVLDDLGAEGDSEAVKETMRALVWARTESSCGTIVTTALTSKQIEIRYGTGFWRRLTDKRICLALNLSAPAPDAAPVPDAPGPVAA